MAKHFLLALLLPAGCLRSRPALWLFPNEPARDRKDILLPAKAGMLVLSLGLQHQSVPDTSFSDCRLSLLENARASPEHYPAPPGLLAVWMLC
jgi:hypothetical protein